MRRFLTVAAMLLSAAALPAKPLRHYVFFNLDRQAAREPAFLGNKAFTGAQIKYTWRQLEPSKDHYDFALIHEDLAVLSAHDKRLFIQLQDVSYYESLVNVPTYLREEPAYHGGADREILDEAKGKLGGWFARRWDPAVRERFHKLLAALGREFDGKIEGINFAETAVQFGDSGRMYPEGFTPEAYRDGVISNMSALKRAFPRSVAMIYGNFMPGEWLPSDDKGYLRSVYAHARELGIAVGGPDLLPHRRGQMNHTYRMIRESAGAVPSGIAVQEGNYSYTNPKTGQRITIAELFEFARDYLHVDYIFWYREEPYFSRDVVPFVKSNPGSGVLQLFFR